MSNNKFSFYILNPNTFMKSPFNFNSDKLYPYIAPLIWDCSNIPIKWSQLEFESVFRGNEKFRKPFLEEILENLADQNGR